jgi:superfamily II DNA/RNA helicase
MFHKKIDEHINQALADIQIEKPQFIQKKIVSTIKSGVDACFLSNEKTGKSTALAVAMIQKLEAALNDVPRAIIVVPDKEKADQLKDMFDLIGKHTNLRVFTVYPGPKLQVLKDQIYFGSDIIIGTPKRLGELYSNNGLNLNDLQYFIVDDASECMKTENFNALDRLFEIMPNVQHAALSHTYNENLERYIEKFFGITSFVK